MTRISVFSNTPKAVVLSIVVILLATALTVSSAYYYQRPSDPLCMRAGAGFPVAFVCSTFGSSPLSSIGRIDWSQRMSLNMVGTVLDLLFYSLLLWGGLLLWQRLSEWRKYHAYLQQMSTGYNTSYRHAGN